MAITIMNDINYTKREMDNHFEQIKGSLSRQDHILEEIKTQVKVTNGRVTSLEHWRWLLVGGGSVVLFILTAIIIPLVFKLL